MNAYWDKAVAAADSARFLLQGGHYDAAASRAYYAMFNAARAALDVQTDLKIEKVRRHSAVLQLFSLHLVKPGFVPAKLGADINSAFRARAVADYATSSVPAADVLELIQLMEEMLKAVEPLLSPEAGKP